MGKLRSPARMARRSVPCWTLTHLSLTPRRLSLVVCVCVCDSSAASTVCRRFQQTYARIRAVDLQFTPRFSDKAKDLIRKMLHKDPKQRMRLEDVPSHPFIKQFDQARLAAAKAAAAGAGAGKRA